MYKPDTPKKDGFDDFKQSDPFARSGKNFEMTQSGMDFGRTGMSATMGASGAIGGAELPHDKPYFDHQDDLVGKDLAKDFNFNPRKFFCRKHKTQEIEYCNQITNNFYCKLCRESYIDRDDKVLSSIAVVIQ